MDNNINDRVLWRPRYGCTYVKYFGQCFVRPVEPEFSTCLSYQLSRGSWITWIKKRSDKWNGSNLSDRHFFMKKYKQDIW